MKPIITVKDMCLWYGNHKALNDINIEIPEKSITALIGPSGCGKSTFLKTLNRMNDLIPNVKITGDLRYEGKDIFARDVDVNNLRKEIGMVFQKQRLCIARALAVQPKVLLMDEPTSALDPISTSRIEELVVELKEKYTIVMVTHNMQQAVRVSDYTAFFLLGDLVEFDKTDTIFFQPQDKRTEDYITGRFG